MPTVFSTTEAQGRRRGAECSGEPGIVLTQPSAVPTVHFVDVVSTESPLESSSVQPGRLLPTDDVLTSRGGARPPESEGRDNGVYQGQLTTERVSFSGKDRNQVRRKALDYWYQHRGELGLNLRAFLDRCLLSGDGRTIIFVR